MKTFNYNVNLKSLKFTEGIEKILKTDNEQSDFFRDGHPLFLISDFYKGRADIWISFMDYLDRESTGGSVWDQDGGEIISHLIIDITSGLTKCTYRAFQIVIDENDIPKDIDVEIEGYVVRDLHMFEDYFLATKVIIL